MNTKIEWATDTWNPITGCSKISEGCEHCYAERIAKRLTGRFGYPADEPFAVTLHPERLEEPLKWRKPRRVFVCSMGDLFHPDVPVSWFKAVYLCIMEAHRHNLGHVFLILTKRPERMADLIKPKEPLSNLWLGVTAENQQQADKRIPILLQIPAAKRFVSVEPMLGPVDLQNINLGPNGYGLDFVLNALTGWSAGFRQATGTEKVRRNDEFGCLDWVICGGETGPGARPMHPDWARSLRDQCVATEIPFFFKQWGEWALHRRSSDPVCELADLQDDEVVMASPPGWVSMLPVGKKKAGRLLDGQLWDQHPEVTT